MILNGWLQGKQLYHTLNLHCPIHVLMSNSHGCIKLQECDHAKCQGERVV